jgi:hypothetical protein
MTDKSKGVANTRLPAQKKHSTNIYVHVIKCKGGNPGSERNFIWKSDFGFPRICASNILERNGGAVG